MVRAMNAGRDKLIATLEELAGEARSGRVDSWENDTLSTYLEALAAWLRVYEQAYVNTGRPVPSDPWDILTAAVRAATIYE
jgi:hypothetical protein